MVCPGFFFIWKQQLGINASKLLDFCLAGYNGVYFDNWILGFGLPATSTFSVFHYHSSDDLLIAVKAESIREAENITNIEMNKILTWAKSNKLDFNEQK